MKIGYDPAKNAWNVARRALPFDDAALLDWSTAVIGVDDRRDYGEVRYRVLGRIGVRLYALVFTQRGPVTWIISFRKANKREEVRYEQEKPS